MVAPTVRVIGADSIVSTMRAAEDRVETCGDGARDLAEKLSRWAQGEAPVRTGRLAASIGAGWGGEVASVNVNVAYAGPIHYGWAAHGISPNPFVTRALAAHRSEAVQTLDGGLQDVADSVRGA